MRQRSQKDLRIGSVPKVTAHYADVSSPESVEAAIAEILEEHGKIDNLVTSAGFTENFEAINYPIDRVRKLWGVNVDGTYLFAIEVAKHLMERKAPGSMVFIGSMSGAIVKLVHVLSCGVTPATIHQVINAGIVFHSLKHPTTQPRQPFAIWLLVWQLSGRMLEFG
jgi:NAD(P)-dependent dehydrogenase (short-subunit alcohol dehydrogenase family)